MGQVAGTDKDNVAASSGDGLPHGATEIDSPVRRPDQDGDNAGLGVQLLDEGQLHLQGVLRRVGLLVAGQVLAGALQLLGQGLIDTRLTQRAAPGPSGGQGRRSAQ